MTGTPWSPALARISSAAAKPGKLELRFEAFNVTNTQRMGALVGGRTGEVGGYANEKRPMIFFVQSRAPGSFFNSIMVFCRRRFYFWRRNSMYKHSFEKAVAEYESLLKKKPAYADKKKLEQYIAENKKQ